MECKRVPQLSKNALKNLSEIFKVNGKRSMLDFIEETDKYLDSLTDSQIKEVKNEIIRFTNSLPKMGSRSKGSKGMTKKRKRSNGGAVNLNTDTENGGLKPTLGGSFNPGYPGGPPGGPPGGFQGGPPGSPYVIQPIQPPLRVVQVLQPVGDQMGSPLGQPVQMQMGQVEMPRGPQGPGIIRGIVRVGVTFFVPRSTTGIIYSGIWLGIALLAGFSAQQHRDFLMLGIEQITSGSCMGVAGFFDVARHPLCTRWRELMTPILTALNEVMKFNLTAMSVLTAGIGAAITAPMMIDAVIYELAYNIDFVITTALQSFSGRPLISPTRSLTRPNIPQLMSRMMGLRNPGTMSALTLGQTPNLTHTLGNQFFVPVPGHPGYGQPYAQAYPVPYAQPYDPRMAQQYDPRMAQQMPIAQQYDPRMAQQYDPRMAQQYDPHQAAMLWDQRMAPPAPRLPRGRANRTQRNVRNNANAANEEEDIAYEAYRRARARSASIRRRLAERGPGGAGNGRRSSNRGGPGNGGPGNGNNSSGNNPRRSGRQRR